MIIARIPANLKTPCYLALTKETISTNITEKQLEEEIVDVNNDTSVINPDIIQEELEKDNSKLDICPKGSVDNLYKILAENLAEQCTFENDSTNSYIEKSITDKMGVGIQPSDEEVNGNDKFCLLVQEANQLSKEMKNTGTTIENYRKVIQKREEAYIIYQTKKLRLLLCNNYFDLAKLCMKSGHYDLVYNYCIKALNYKLAYIEFLNSKDREYYDQLYEIGCIYQLIGDVTLKNYEWSYAAYNISSAFLDIASTDGGTNRYYSDYFCGMVNHKLIVLKSNNNQNSYALNIRMALNKYEKALKNSNYNNNKGSLCRFSKNVCNYGIQHNRKYGNNPNFLKTEELETKMKFMDNKLSQL